MRLFPLLFSILLVHGLFSGIQHASAGGSPITNDTDLSGIRPEISSFHRAFETIPLDLQADTQKISSIPNGLVIEVLRMEHSQLTPVQGLRFKIEGTRNKDVVTDATGKAVFQECPAGNFKVGALLKNQWFSVAHSSEPYQIIAKELVCGSHVQLIFKQDSAGGQALGIWQVAARALLKLQKNIGLSFWTESLPFLWPAEGDYYSWGEVNITQGDRWDVVGHELGHAIYHMGEIGAFGGGAHKIDECYTDALALSEGWASYFSAWVSLELNDSDAKFEYMVPRRAPIRIENIPADVCAGPTSEWRATGFFWDLIDLNEDNETSKASFADIWNALKGTESQSMMDVAQHIEKAGIPAEWIDIVWNLNFQTPR